MQTTKPTKADLACWQETFAAYRSRLSPNRKTGRELAAYLEDVYPVERVDDARWREVVTSNVTANAFSRDKIPAGAALDARVYRILRKGAGKKLYLARGKADGGDDIIVGIELVTGEFHVESSSDLWDLLFAFRGLDAQDLENAYLVAEYITCLGRFGRLVDANGQDGALLIRTAPGTR